MMSRVKRCSGKSRWVTFALLGVVLACSQIAMAEDATWVTATGASYPTWFYAGTGVFPLPVPPGGYPDGYWNTGTPPGTYTPPLIGFDSDLAIFNCPIATGNSAGNLGVPTPNTPLYLGGFDFTASASYVPGQTSGSVSIGTYGAAYAYGFLALSPDGWTDNGHMMTFESGLTTTNLTYNFGFKNVLLDGVQGNGSPASSPPTYSIIDNSPSGAAVRFGGILWSNYPGTSTLILGGTDTNAVFASGSGKIVNGAYCGYQDTSVSNAAGAFLQMLKTGPGTWTIPTQTGMAFSGPVTIQQGTLKLSSSAAGPDMTFYLSGSPSQTTIVPTIDVQAGTYLDINGGGSSARNLVLEASTSAPYYTTVGMELEGNGTVIAGSTTAYGTVSLYSQQWGRAAYGAPTLRPGDALTGAGTLTTGSEAWFGAYGGDGTYLWTLNAVTGTGTQAAANGGDSYLGGSELVMNGSLNVAHLGTTGGANPGYMTLKLASLNGTNGGPPIGWSSTGNYTWTIATFSNGVTGGTFTTNMLSINTSGFGGTIKTGAGFGFSLSSDANDLYLTYVGGYPPPPLPAHYTLDAVAANLNLLKGATTTVTTTITNSGLGDSLNYTALAAGAVGMTPSSGGPLGFGQSGSGTGTFTGSSFGNATLTPTATATNATIGGSATQDSASSVTINVGVATVVGSGGTFAGATTLTSQAIGAGGSLAGLASMTNAGGAVVGTTGTILAGTTEEGTTVTMKWRAPNGPTETGVGTGLISDVLELGGMNSGDVYTVSLTYSASLLSSLYGGPSAQLDEWNGSAWVAAGTNNVGNVAPDATPGDYGYFGGAVWANLTGGGDPDLAAVPEPSSIILILSGLAMAIFAWRRLC